MSQNRTKPDHMHLTDYVRDLPVRRMVLLVLVWLALLGLNKVLIDAGLNPGTPIHFPLSVFVGPRLIPAGWPFIVLFVVVFCFALRYRQRMGLGGVWAVGSLLILLANLAQGGLEAGLYAPFTESGIQYYHDAIQVSDWLSWLSNFNIHQSGLLEHSKTHPPFAILIHKLLLDIGDRNVPVLALSFFLLSSCTIPLVYMILKCSGADKPKASQIALLFSVIPAFNIYSAVSLDGVIATLSALSLLGMVWMTTRQSTGLVGAILLIAGVVSTSALSFGSVFLLLTAGFVAARQIVLQKRWSIFLALLSAILILLLLQVGAVRFFGYNHIQAFFTASRLENPEGFLGFSDPLLYTMTRIEGISQIAFFLSLGVLGVLLDFEFLKAYSRRGTMAILPFAALASLGLIFLTGAFRNGETARVCLFIYPYLMLPLALVEDKKLLPLLVLAGVQTISMQALGGYFW